MSDTNKFREISVQVWYPAEPEEIGIYKNFNHQRRSYDENLPIAVTAHGIHRT